MDTTTLAGAASAALSADLNDQQLMSYLASGDVAALELLYQRYSRPVFSLAIRILADQRDAEEVTQDVFERVWRYAARYDHQRGRFATWLLSLTHHVAVDALRRRLRRPGTLEGEAAELITLQTPSSNSDTAERAERNEQAEVIRAALRLLPKVQQQAIELAYFKGMSHLEIAAALGDPLGTVKTRIRRGMARLKAVLEQQLGSADATTGDEDLKETAHEG